MIEFLHMPKELNGLSDRVWSVTLVPTREKLPHMYGQEDWAVKEAGRGGAQQNEDVI